ncbi:phosphoribosylamine--glycine ligase [Candidatus Sororendozoicomonas aggregata]|uniref:phosphoribosylamine--glycine ligase n=1 Tax=Candidatus Sororendozoicomonas aggregata TaxID=3073239 RepID=UPI002ED05A73
MKVLIIGSGGREHALAWKVSQNANVTHVFVAPGNAGTAQEPKVSNVTIDALAIKALAEFAQQEAIDLTIVGPEAPLVAGVVDHFESLGLTIFGPGKAAAQLEGSKAFSKDFLARHNIPTAEYQSFTDISAAKAYIAEKGAPVVVKADGLAAGKGVILARTNEEAFAAVEDMLAGNAFGEAGHKVVVEEFLHGEEASFIVMVDGKHVLPLATSQDHKARDNGDKGPNTGGMGAYSPAPVVTQAIYDRIMTEVIYPTVEGMAEEGIAYKGFLYAGIMITPEGTPCVLEYNCRFGDPETQPILMRLQSSLAELCLKGAKGELAGVHAQWDSRTALGVVMSAGGYPNTYRKGDSISGLAHTHKDTKVFQAGTKAINGEIVTNGGRVLCVTALGDTAEDAQTKAYQAVGSIQWKGAYFRTDIGYRAIK